MIEYWILALYGMAGIALGVFFYGGLWWTIQRGIAAKQPALWFLGSLVLRMGVTLGGFYFIAVRGLIPVLVALACFFLARLLVTYATRPALNKTGVSHAA